MTDYEVKDDYAHVLARRDMWLGDVNNATQPMYLYDWENNKLTYEKATFNFGLLKVFDEILVNAIDNIARTKTGKKLENIWVDFIDVKGFKSMAIRVKNDGPSIPIEKYTPKPKAEGESAKAYERRMEIESKLTDKYIPEILFTVLRSSSNYNVEDEKTRTTGGLNGLGAKLTSIFSTYFSIDICNKGTRYQQTMRNHNDIIEEPKIAKTRASDYVQVTFIPDWTQLDKDSEFNDLNADMLKILAKRVFDYSHLGINLFINDKHLPNLSFLEFTNLHMQLHDPEIEMEEAMCVGKFKQWKVAYGFSPLKIDKISYVNNVVTYKGGQHVNLIRDQVIDAIQKKLKKQANVKTITARIAMSVYAIIPGVAFSSQAKTALSTDKLEVPQLNKAKLDKFIEENGIVDFFEKSKVKSKNKKTQRSRITNIDKLRDAEEAGKPMNQRTEKNHICTLFICEGDSAQTLCTRGIKILGEQYYGSFALRGKLLNTLKSTNDKYLQNVELTNLKQAIGLVDGKKYTDTKSLRYQRIVCCKDADYDGSSIMGLVINFFYQYFRELMLMPDFFYEFITPVVNVYMKPYVPKTSYPIKCYYNLNVFNQDFKKGYIEINGKKIETSKLITKYIKGLGGNTDNDIEVYFKDFNRYLIHIDCATEKTKQNIMLAYSEDRFKKSDKIPNLYYSDEELKRVDKINTYADLRKIWITNVNDSSYLPRDSSEITFDDFCDIDLALASYDTCERSIPSVIDGLKPSQRKVIYTFFNMSKEKASTSTKVFQLTGKVADFASYHHGDSSLNETITKMGQDFVGSNNIPLIEKDGQFGSRNKLGKDASAPRYIAGYLSKLARLIFPKIDDELLTTKIEDNSPVEPLFYIPIIPMLLVNGATGIGTGWSTDIPMFNPDDLIRITWNRLEGKKELLKILPWCRNYKGTVVDMGDFWRFIGNIDKINTTTYRINEIPVGMSIDELRDQMNQMIETGILKEYVNMASRKSKKEIDNDPDAFEFILTFMSDKVTNDMDESDIATEMNLYRDIRKTNMVAFDHECHPRRYKDIDALYNEWYEVRMDLYKQRYNHIIELMKLEILKLKNKLRFCQNIKKYKLEEKNKKEFISLLETEKYDKFNDCYDYITTMSIDSVAKYKIDELINQIAKKEEELRLFQKKTAIDLWKQDLLDLVDAM